MGGEDAAADLANCELPSLPKVWSWSAGERGGGGGGGASSATKLRGSAGLGATSSLARRNPLPIGFSLTFPSPFLSSSSLSFFPNTFFLPSDLRLLQPEPSQGSALGLLIPPAASTDARPASGRRKEEKLVGGVSPSHSDTLPANPDRPRGPP